VSLRLPLTSPKLPSPARAAAALARLARADVPPPPRALAPDVEELHFAACAAGADGYTEPSTGLFVFSALSHLRRGACCGKACRHCPYSWEKVPPAKR
jgi:hypothetical protein